ncbi:MAG TPA: META domain-containing protein [Chitinophagaceae bacterium]|nr:META domain-containing protein [Chitinophagaceae bacterium]
MKKLILLALLGIFFISCHSSKKSSINTIEEKSNILSLNGTWQLQMLFASDNNWAKQPGINININEKTFSGNSGCNSISGKFTIADNYIGFDKNINSTKMACQGNYEKTFLAALLKINRYTITKDELELGQGEIVLMKLKRSGD